MRATSKTDSGILRLAEDRGRLSALSSLDWGLLVPLLLLVGIGLATVHSASAEMPVDYLPRQLLWVGLGLVALVVGLSIDYHRLVDLSPFFYLAGLLALVAVLFFGSGPGGTHSWISIRGIRLGQPAEFAKLATLLFLARHLAEAGRRFLGLGQIAAAALIVGLPMALVVLQPDLGSAAMFAPLLGGMLVIAGVRLRILVGAALAFALVGALVWNFGMKQYQRERVHTFLSPESDPLGAGYQVRQSKIAVGSGQLLGRGYMQGTQSQLRFLPARHTDFIFAVLAEERGFLGVLGVLGLFGAFVLNGLRVAMRARDRTGILLVIGFLGIFAFHVLYNTAMVVGLVPITGIPLPFFSYGGSFMLLNFFGAGLILNVDLRRYVNR